jgi:membrane-bound lytic murein transglycosylase A
MDLRARCDIAQSELETFRNPGSGLNRAWRLAACILLEFMYTSPAIAFQPVPFEILRGWAEDDHAAAFSAFRRSCAEILLNGKAFERQPRFAGRRADWAGVCTLAGTAGDPRAFFEENFLAFKVIDEERPEGLFTGYYEPEVKGSRSRSSRYEVPIYARPADLVAFDLVQQQTTRHAYGRIVDGKPYPYLTRREIEQGALSGSGLELLWLEDWADAFFIHVQGSGLVRLEDGTVVRLAYSAKSGRAYTGIGGLLVERGVFTRDEMSMQAVRRWMSQNPREARQLMWENESFIFFQEAKIENPSLGPLGAQHVQLTPNRSLAVDRSLWAFGMPVWLDTKAPTGAGAGLEDFKALLIAQDTGSAIKGAARGDVFWGAGEKAALAAGHMKSPGTMVVLLPYAVAQSLGLVP